MTGNREMCNRKHQFKGRGKFCQICGHAREDNCHHRTRLQYDKEQTCRNRIGQEIACEATRASDLYGPFVSVPEAWGVLQGELRELENEVLVNKSKRNLVKTRAETIQVAAALLNLVYYCCDGE